MYVYIYIYMPKSSGAELLALVAPPRLSAARAAVACRPGKSLAS